MLKCGLFILQKLTKQILDVDDMKYEFIQVPKKKY